MLLPNGKGLIQSWSSVTDRAAPVQQRGQMAKIAGELISRDPGQVRRRGGGLSHRLLLGGSGKTCKT